MIKQKKSDAIKALEPKLARAIATMVKEYYLSENPPPDKVMVPVRYVKIVNDEGKEYYQASVVSETTWTNKTAKKHQVIIRFELTAAKTLDLSTLHYYP